MIVRRLPAKDDTLEGLGGLLKRCRRRISPERPSLGAFLRMPGRIGKTVTQEEVAEAVGISRQWYALMETGRTARFSAAVLGRVADALTMDPAERAALFRLAVPELRATSLTDRSIAVLETIASLRSVTRRLWSATTGAEALTLVREYAMTQLAPDATVTVTRIREGYWDYAVTGANDEGERLKRFDALVRERWGACTIDDLLCYTLMAQPGDVVTRADRNAYFPDLAAKVQPALDTLGFSDVSFATAHVQSRHAFVARIVAFHRTAYAYSEIERAHLGTLADLTSLALSGGASSGAPT